jgi:hypothetical protein
MRSVVALSISALALTAPVGAQDQTAQEMRAVLEAKLQVERARVSVESRVTKGAPYSAEAVTETLQVLGDGNRISRKSVTRIARDTEGRTRRETVSTTGEVTTINISDPVAQSTYFLDARTKTASRTSMTLMGGRVGFVSAPSETPGVSVRRFETTAAEVPAAELKARQEVELAAASGGAGAGARGAGGGARAGGGGRGGAVAPTAAAVARPGTNVTNEDLGSQIVEGVMATGTRSTTTIEAGVIGNAQPIHVVSEQWYSEDLKVLVKTRHSDPRTGDTTYRLTNVILAEPAKTLFEVPADYTLKESEIRRENPLK